LDKALNSFLFEINQYLWIINILKMIKEENNKSFDWVYSVLGLFFGIITAAVISGSFLWSLFGGVLGLIMGAVFLNSIVKGRKY
jgi:hypothetical protein